MYLSKLHFIFVQLRCMKISRKCQQRRQKTYWLATTPSAPENLQNKSKIQGGQQISTIFFLCDCVCVLRETVSPFFCFWSKESIVLLRSNLREEAQLESEGEGFSSNRVEPLLPENDLEFWRTEEKTLLLKNSAVSMKGKIHNF